MLYVICMTVYVHIQKFIIFSCQFIVVFHHSKKAYILHGILYAYHPVEF